MDYHQKIHLRAIRKKWASQRGNEIHEPKSKNSYATHTSSREGLFSMKRKAIFECKESWCRKSYKRQKHEKRHTNSHSNQRSHRCWVPECHRAFVRPDHLNAHYKNVHGRQVGRTAMLPVSMTQARSTTRVIVESLRLMDVRSISLPNNKIWRALNHLANGCFGVL